MEEICKNCGTALAGKYCYTCGQKGDVPAFTFKHIAEEAFHAFTHADKSFVSFIKQLIVNPGLIAYEYIAERKRKRYFNPFTFFVLISGISAFVVSAKLHLKEKLFHQNNEYGHLFNIYDKLFSLVTVPLFGLAVWAIHVKKPKLRFSEYTVFAMIILSLFNLVDVVVQSINYYIAYFFHSSLSIEDNPVYLVLMIAYIGYANYQFHKKMHASTVFQSLLTGVVFFVVQALILLFFIYGYVNDFKGIGNVQLYGITISDR